MSDQLIPHGCGFEDVAVSLVDIQQALQPPRQAAILKYQEGSDSESQYSTGTNSPDDQRSLSGTESPYEGSPYEELAEFNFIPSLPLSFPPISSESSDSSFLTNIPTELHLLIFSHLDPLDSTCLGLTNAHFYNLQKALHGTTPLSTRRKGHDWEVHGKQECRHCGIHRCQLHMHLRDWIPGKYEYCAIRQVYGLKAQEGAGAGRKAYCHRSNPLKPGRCGRHPVKEVHFED
jgi:hypothetical protein